MEFLTSQSMDEKMVSCLSVRFIFILLNTLHHHVNSVGKSLSRTENMLSNNKIRRHVELYVNSIL